MLGALGLPAAAQAATLRVPSQYPTLSLALSAANDFDTIAVAVSSYTPETNALAVNRSVTIQPDGLGRVVLPPLNIGSGVFLSVRGAEIRAANTSPAALATHGNALVTGTVLALDFEDVLFTAPAAPVRAVSVSGAGSVVLDGFTASNFTGDAVFHLPLSALRLQNGSVLDSNTTTAPVVVGAQDTYIDSVVFDRNSGLASGAVLADGPGGLLSVARSSFVGCTSSDGAALTLGDGFVGGVLVVSSSSFMSNASESHAADVLISPTDVSATITDSTFSDSLGVEAASISTQSSLGLTGGEFIGPMSAVGGAIAVLGGTFTGNDLTWTGMSTSLYGGGLYASGGEIIGNDWYMDDSSVVLDGALMWSSVPTFVSNVTASNTRAQRGGLVFLAEGGALSGSGWDVDTVTATRQGAMMFAEDGTALTLANVQASHLSADSGAVASVGDGSLDVAGLTVSDWSVEADGGLIAADGAIVTLSQAAVSAGSGASSGGLLWVRGGSAVVDGVDVEDVELGDGSLFYAENATLAVNSLGVSSLSAGRGALVYGVNTALTLEQVDVSALAGADDGGAIWLSGGSAAISGVIADDISVTRRGGFLASYGASVTLTDAQFSDLAADQGAVAYVEDGAFTVRRVRGCSGDAADGSFVYVDGASPLLVENSILQDNEDESGAALRVFADFGDTFAARNNTFVGASSPLGHIAGAFGGVELVNNLFAEAAYGVYFTATPSGVVSSRYNSWFDNLASTNTTGDPWLPEATAIYADPLYGARQVGQCHALLFLDTESPARNAGDPTISNRDGRRSDIGAFGGPGAFLPDEDNDGFGIDVDCNDNNAAINPFASDVWGDGVDSDCRGNDDWDRDGDGYVRTQDAGPGKSSLPGGDCNDADALTRPGAADAWYDGLDRDCNGADDYDADRDGYVADEYSSRSALPAGDCDDTDADRNPGEDDAWYDGFDADCDGADDYDKDGDGYVPNAYDLLTILPGNDCNDNRDDVHPGANDVWYDGVDADCDAENDWDQDGDGYVSSANAAVAGLPGGDCDDTSVSRRPGASDAWYDGFDANCDGANDYDQDGDGFVPDAWAAAAGRPGGDCDDTRASTRPGVTDDAYDGRDANCDGANDYDQDGDGYTLNRYEDEAGLPGGDCDDADEDARPGRNDRWYDGFDANCDGLNDYDKDGDGYVASEFAAAAGLPGGDCDDDDADRSPAAADAPYDGLDENCDGASEFDLDNDGRVLAGQGAASGKPEGDCNDRNAQIYTGAPETWYDGLDSNCDSRDDYDQDGDGYVPDAYAAQSRLPAGDCNDAPVAGLTQRPGLADAWYDGVDSNCDGVNDYDQDSDGYAPSAFAGPAGLPGGDCDDTAAARFPSAEEQWYDGIDQNCDGGDDYDQDGDGFPAGGATPAPPVIDCDDGDVTVRPGAAAKSCTSVDCDCDGADDWDGDGDGYAAVDADETYPGELPDGDCDDADDARNPGAADVPDDGIDQDCSGGDVETWIKAGFGCSTTGGGGAAWLAVAAVAALARRRR